MNRTFPFGLLLIFLSLQANVLAQAPFYAGGQDSWEENIPPANDHLTYALYLIGDAGEPDFSKPSALKILKPSLVEAGKNSAVIFLGDNIYPAGIPEEEEKNRAQAESRLSGSLEAIKDYQGRIVFVPGNHDWDHWGKEGLQGIRREEQFIENQLQRGNTFIPDSGCPGPVAIELADDLVLVVIDTQWWLHANEKPAGPESRCTSGTDEEFIAAIDRVLDRYKGRHIVVAAHHPLISNGYHGGRFPLKEHLFPLTAKLKWLYLPLPVLGSAYVFSRKYLGHIQDISNPRYTLLTERLFEVFSNHEGIIYAAGHDHNLQYFERQGQHYLVSGSGSKVNPVAGKHGASFTCAKQGFMRLNLYQSGAIWLEVWTAGGRKDSQGVLVFRKSLGSKP